MGLLNPVFRVYLQWSWSTISVVEGLTSMRLQRSSWIMQKPSFRCLIAQAEARQPVADAVTLELQLPPAQFESWKRSPKSEMIWILVDGMADVATWDDIFMKMEHVKYRLSPLTASHVFFCGLGFGSLGTTWIATPWQLLILEFPRCAWRMVWSQQAGTCVHFTTPNPASLIFILRRRSGRAWGRVRESNGSTPKVRKLGKREQKAPLFDVCSPFRRSFSAF